MTLYSLNGSYPAPLPFRIHLSNGASRTDPSTFTPDEIADAGFVEAQEIPEYDPAEKALGWDGTGWVLTDLPPVFDQPKSPVLYAAAQLQIDGFDITGIEINSRLGGAFWVDTGKYVVIFSEELTDTSYMIQASAGPCSAYVLPSDKLTDSFTVTTTSFAGDPTDAEYVNLYITRAV